MAYTYTAAKNIYLLSRASLFFPSTFFPHGSGDIRPDTYLVRLPAFSWTMTISDELFSVLD